MAVIVANEGKVIWASRALYGASAENMTLKLFSNNFTPAVGDTSASFTEATFTGYSAFTLTSTQSGSTWSVPTIASDIASSTYGTTATWTATSDQTIYGWYIVGATSGKVMLAEKFTAGKPLVGASSDQLSIIPKIQFKTAV